MTVGQTRRGGFGGAAGLAAYLREHAVEAVVDATHPFAAQMSRNAAEACAEVGVPLVRVLRPSWAGHPLADGWAWVDSHAEAAETAAGLLAGRRAGGTVGSNPLEGAVLLTVGRQHTADYLPALGAHRVVARVAEAPDLQLPEGWEVLSSRGPFTADGERALFGEHAVEVLVTKDSGGPMTDAKLVVAEELGVAVVVVRRPKLPAGVPEVPTVEAALEWLDHLPTPN